MTNQNIHSRPKVVLNNSTIHNLKSASYNNPGNNQISSLKCVVGDPEFFNTRLFNREIKFYIDEGGGESTPVFTGFIRDAVPKEDSVSFTAYDCRTFISGREAEPVVITDKDNYDGFTAVQFLADVINKNSLDISLSALSDTEPPIPMKGIRSTISGAYDVFINLLKRISDDSDPRNPLNYVVDVIGKKLVITKKRSKGGNGIRFSRNDGINSINISRRAPITKATVYGSNSSSGTFQYGSSPSGSIGTTHSDNRLTNNEECTELAMRLVMAERNEIDEISISASKGYDLGLNNVIY